MTRTRLRPHLSSTRRPDKIVFLLKGLDRLRESLRGRCDVLLSTVDQLEGCRLDCRLLEKYVSRSVPKWDEAVLACYSGDRPGEAVVD